MIEEDFSCYNGEGTVLRKAQLIMLNILVEVDKICKRYNIPYWIDYGTLLGAVRHKGFIPWDDDLDISVLKKDYKRLSDALKKELPDHLAYQDWKNERRLTFKVIKVRDRNSYYDDGLTKKGEMVHQGIFIDIFAVEPIPSVRIKKMVDFLYGRCLRRLRKVNENKTEFLIAILIWPLAITLVGFSRFITLFTNRKLLANIYGGLNLPAYHSKDTIFPLCKIEFEGKEFFAPGNYDQHLREIYGDYMKIPPRDKRITHALSIELQDNNAYN